MQAVPQRGFFFCGYVCGCVRFFLGRVFIYINKTPKDLLGRVFFSLPLSLSIYVPITCVFLYRCEKECENENGNNQHYFYDFLWILIATCYYRNGSAACGSITTKHNCLSVPCIHSARVFFHCARMRAILSQTSKSIELHGYSAYRFFCSLFHAFPWNHEKEAFELCAGNKKAPLPVKMINSNQNIIDNTNIRLLQFSSFFLSSFIQFPITLFWVCIMIMHVRVYL